MLASPFTPPVMTTHTNGAKPMATAAPSRKGRPQSPNGVSPVVRRFVKNNPGRQFTAEDVLREVGGTIESESSDLQRGIRQFLSRIADNSEVARVGWGVYIAPGSTGDTPEPEPETETEPVATPPSSTLGRQKGAKNKYGVSATIRRYLKKHPGQRFTADAIVQACGPEIAQYSNHPDLGHIVRQTLTRLCSNQEITRFERGVYTAPGTAKPQTQPKPVAKTAAKTAPAQRTKKETEPVSRNNAIAVRETPTPQQEDHILEGVPVHAPADAAAVVLANSLVENLEANGIHYTFLRENGVVRIEWMRPER